MKRAKHIVLVVVLGVAAVAWWPHPRKADAVGGGGSARAAAAVGNHSSKSGREGRHADLVRGSRDERSAERREGRRWQVAPTAPGESDRLTGQPGEAEAVLTGTPRDDASAKAEPAGTIVLRPDGGSASALDLAQQVRLQREGRSEFMRRRFEELASHQPGCKCGYHLGEK